MTPTNRTSRTPLLLIAAGVLCLLGGSYLGIFVAPPEHFMGNVQRIMYVHVPTAWNAMLAICFSFICALMFLLKNAFRWDARLEAANEMFVVLAFLLCCQGSIWARPTWGVWWDWDPRLTSMAVLLVAMIGVVALRHFIEDPVKRAVWSSVATILASADVPIVYYSVRWWNSLHQLQSSPATVSKAFHLPLRLNAVGILLLMIGLITLRTRLAASRLESELAPPPLANDATGSAIGGFA